MPLPPRRAWLLALLAVPALLLLLLLVLALFPWNWARGPLQDFALKKTGRTLLIAGDLDVSWSWPRPRVTAQDVSFANPAWALAPQMVQAPSVDVTLDLPALLRGQLAFPELRLTRPQVFLEQASGGRKTWLLDLAQTDEAVRIPIGHVLLDEGRATYIHTAEQTAMHIELSTSEPGAAPAALHSLHFRAQGLYRGQAVLGRGSGGAVLAWRDDDKPYPLRVQATLGETQVSAEGSVTSLSQWAALDLQIKLSGDNLASLFPLIGIALPPTPAYRSAGRLVREGTVWRYADFTGQVGQSDLAGTLQVDTAGARPLLTGALVSRRLALVDLGPAVGGKNTATALAPGEVAAPATAAVPQHVLPNLPLDTGRWASLDADVTLKAQTLTRPQGLPLDKLSFHLLLKDRQLSLAPLDFGIAGGQLSATVMLDGREKPLLGRLKARLRGMQLAKLLPGVDLNQASIGVMGGEIELSGSGASVGRMLATADGRVSLVAQNGQISRLLMEQVGLHLLEILRFKLTGDESIRLNCLVADFVVAKGVMGTRALVLDTEVNTVVGQGSINLANETLDLTVVPHTKVTSLVALRSPIHVTGPFRQPAIDIDKGKLAARGGGALLLGLLNPLLALVPLFDSGPGLDTDCKALVQAARAPTGTK